MATPSRSDASEAREVDVEVLPKEREGVRFEHGAGRPGEGTSRLEDPLVALVARLMDSVFTIPGTKIKFGLDPILGLLPVVGSPASAFVSLFLLARSAQHGVPNFVLARMAVNIAINAILDEIPVVGDGLSIFFRSNKMNYELLEKYAHTKRQHSWGDRLLVTAILAGVALFLLCAVLGFFLLAGKLYHWALS